MKKIITLALSLLMLFTIACPVVADDENEIPESTEQPLAKTVDSPVDVDNPEPDTVTVLTVKKIYK